MIRGVRDGCGRKPSQQAHCRRLLGAPAWLLPARRPRTPQCCLCSHPWVKNAACVSPAPTLLMAAAAAHASRPAHTAQLWPDAGSTDLVLPLASSSGWEEVTCGCWPHLGASGDPSGLPQLTETTAALHGNAWLLPWVAAGTQNTGRVKGCAANWAKNSHFHSLNGNRKGQLSARLLLGEHLQMANTLELPTPLYHQYTRTGAADRYSWGSSQVTHKHQGDRRCFGLRAVVFLFLIK